MRVRRVLYIGLISLFSLPIVAQTAPNITSISPTVGPVSPVGGSVTIKGTGFGPAPSGSTVTFAGIAGAPTSWNDTRIVVPVPAVYRRGSRTYR